MTRQITGILDVPREELEQASSLLAPGEPLVLKIQDPEVTEAYDNWRTESGKDMS